MKNAQVGNKFVITGGYMRDTPSSGRYIRHHYPVGTVVTLVGANDDDYGYYEDAKGYEQCVSDRFVKPFEEATSVIKANVGDKFEVIEARAAFKVGDIVTLVRYDGDGCNKYENAEGYGQHMKDCRLKKVTEPTVKIGDKFVITGGGSYHHFSDGEVVTIVQTDFEDGVHYYEGSNGKRKWVKPGMITPYVEEAPQVIESLPKVGDKFKVVDGGGEYPIGTIVTLSRICEDGCHKYSSETRGEWYVNTERLVPFTEPLKFNVGDEVTTIPNIRPYRFGEAIPGVITSTDADGRGHRGQYMVAIPSSLGGTYEIGFKEEEIEMRAVKPTETPKAKKSAKEGDYIVIDIEEARSNSSTFALDLTEGEKYLVCKDSYGELYFVDDIADERTIHIEEGWYTVVDATKAETPIQVGDYVVGMNDTRYFITNENMLLGKVIRVDSGDKLQDDYIKVEVVKAVPGTNTEEYVGHAYTILASEVRKATEEEIEAVIPKPKPVDPYEGRGFSGEIRKKGDKVLVLRDPDFPELAGTIQEVKEAYGGMAGGNVELTNGKIVFGNNVELVEEAKPEVKPEAKFEVGDIVRITEATTSVNLPGDIGEVVEEQDGVFRVSVNARASRANWNGPSSLELIAKGRK